MTNKKLMKKIAPVVMSAAVAMTSMPYAVLASDFTDSEVLTDSTDFSVSEEFAAEDAQEEFTTEDVQDAFAAEAQQGEAYVLMNIPYDDFYKAELKNNDVKVDAFTSATLNKSRTAGMMNGNSAYHVDPNGTDVTGVTFPVKVSDLSLLKDQKQVTDSDSVTITVTNRGQTSSNTYTGKDSLIENASYSYYILSETPSYYKELTVNADGSYSFSAMKGAQTQTVAIDAILKTETTYGDYELDLNNETFSSLIDTTTDKIYGVTVNTTDGTNYGLRHLENIWRGSMLAWGTGYTTEVHGCPVSSAHYKSIMGKTIDSVTYYTDKGMITFDVPDVKVQTTTGIKATVADIMNTDSSAAVTFDQALPADFKAQYTVDGTAVSCTDGKLAVGALALGTHKVEIADASGKYAAIVTEFTVNTDKMPASYDSNETKLVAAKGITAEEFSAYIKSISKVKVDDTEYAATGMISAKTDAVLRTLLYPRDVFEKMADASWGINRTTGEKEPEDLVFTRKMAALYNKSAYDGKERVLEIHYTDLNHTYQIWLGKEGSEVVADGSLTSTTRIDTPFAVWLAISRGEIGGAEALGKQMYTVAGDFSLMIDWDKFFGSRAAVDKAETASSDTTKQKKPTMAAMLIPWITFWIAVSINPAPGAVIALTVAAAIPLLMRNHKLVIWDRLSIFAVAVLSAAANITGNGNVPTNTGYLIFGLFWLISCLTKEPLCAAYVKYSYGGESARQNPLFMRTNYILAAAWGLLYVLTAIWTFLFRSAGIANAIIIVNNLIPVLMGLFTLWFQKWYPARMARGKTNRK